MHNKIIERMNSHPDVSWKRNYSECLEELLKVNFRDVFIGTLISYKQFNFRFKINGKACTKRISFQENNENVGIVIEGQAANYFTSRHCNLYSVGSLTESFYSLAFPKGKKFDIIE